MTTPINMKNNPRFRRLRALAVAASIAFLGAMMLGQAGDDDYNDAPSPTKAAPAQEQATKPAAATTEPKKKSSVITSVPPGTPYNQRQELLNRGKIVYQNYCAGCHGNKGDGNGPASARLITKPRDFTREIYKFRTTDSSSLPMEADLHRTITRGLARVSMPAFPLMPEQDKVAVIQYIKSFYAKWDQEAPDRKLVFVPNAPKDLKDKTRIDRGRAVYLAMGCANCHGKDGAGTDAVQSVFTDAWGHPQAAFNFTRGRLKSGDNPEDIYRVFHAGLRSIMPSFPGETLAYVSGEQVQAAERFFLPGEPASLEAAIKAFPATTGEIGALSAQERLDRAVNNSWDMVAYIESLRAAGGVATGKSTPKPPAPQTPVTPSPKVDDYE